MTPHLSAKSTPRQPHGSPDAKALQGRGGHSDAGSCCGCRGAAGRGVRSRAISGGPDARPTTTGAWAAREL